MATQTRAPKRTTVRTRATARADQAPEHGHQRHRSLETGSGGRRLVQTFSAVGTLPALEESRNQLMALAWREPFSEDDVIAGVEADPALTIAVVRAASGKATSVGSVPQAVVTLGPGGVEKAVDELEIYRLFESAGVRGDTLERFRRHALATRNAAERVAGLGDAPYRNEISLAALLHDVGQLALSRPYPAYPEMLEDKDLTPEGRVNRECLELGVDHSLLGGVMLRQWGLSAEVAAVVEGHHGRGARGVAAIVRTVDRIAHHRDGKQIGISEAVEAAELCGIDGAELRALLAEDPYCRKPRRRPSQPSPLSKCELSAVHGLAEGKAYKQIAADLGLFASTIRSHLHNAYRKLGVADRAQVVILARDRGWI